MTQVEHKALAGYHYLGCNVGCGVVIRGASNVCSSRDAIWARVGLTLTYVDSKCNVEVCLITNYPQFSFGNT